MTARRGHSVLGQPKVGQRAARGDLQLQADEVEAGDLLGDRVLHLQARVALDENHVLAVHEELHGAQAAVTCGLGQRDAITEEALADGHRQSVGGRDLDHLLPLPLQRALAVPEMDHVRAVAHDLHLQVPGPRQKPLEVEVAVAEGGLGLRGAALEGLFQLVERRGWPHAAPAPAGHRLDHHRPVGGEESLGLFQRRGPVRARQHRHAALLRERPRPALVPEQLQRLGCGTHEG